MYCTLSLSLYLFNFCLLVYTCVSLKVINVIYFKGGKKTPLSSATLTEGGDEFQIQAEKDSSTNNKGKVIKR